MRRLYVFATSLRGLVDLRPPQQIEALEALKSMEPHSLQMRLEDLEVGQQTNRAPQNAIP